VRAFDLLQPTSVDEAVALLRQHGDEARLIGGGAMLTILLRERLIAPRVLVSVLLGRTLGIGGGRLGTALRTVVFRGVVGVCVCGRLGAGLCEALRRWFLAP